MLEGLEISIKYFQELQFNNPTYRLDSEFYKKEYLWLFEQVFSKSTNKLEKVSEWITQGPNPIFSESKIPCLTGRNISNGRVNYNNADYVSDVEYEKLKRFQLKKGDTLITLKGKGSIGKIGYVTKNRKAIFSRDIGVIRPNNINSGYVNAYILSHFGSKIIERGETGGTGQSTLTASYLRNIDIVRVKIEDEIGDLIIKSEQTLEESKELYNQSEVALLQEIGLKDFTPSTEAVNIKSFKESFGTSGRIDAEYYQKKYDELEFAIISSGNYKTILDIRTDNYRGLQPKYVENGELSIINSKHILEDTLDYNNFQTTSSNYWDEQKRARVFKNDILTYTTGANIGRTQVYQIDDQALASNHVNILRLQKTYNPIYVGFIMNSFVGRLQTEKLSAGSAQAELYSKDIDKFLIPIVEIEKQNEIAELIKESFALKKQSEHLLEVAKKAVEIAIEENEESAIAYINKETA